MPDWTCPECKAQHVGLKGRTCPGCGYIRPKLAPGFASMKISPERQREIRAMGGRTAHRKGKAHRWTSAEAQRAGRKGGKLRHAKPAKSKQRKRKERTEEE